MLMVEIKEGREDMLEAVSVEEIHSGFDSASVYRFLKVSVFPVIPSA